MEDINKQTIAGLDINQQLAFIKYYKGLPEKSKTTVRFFNRGDYYCAHGDDAELIQRKSNVVYLVKNFGHYSQTLETLMINKSNFQVLVRELLLVKHHRIEVYSNKSNLKNTAGWELEFWASPGNLTQFEELLFSENQGKDDTSLLMAVKRCGDKASTVGVALVDMDTKRFYMGEIPDDDYFSNLEAFIVQKSPKECLLPADYMSENKNKIVAILERNAVCTTGRKKSEFTEADLMQDAARLLHWEEGELRNARLVPEMCLAAPTLCLAALIRYLELMNNEDNMNQFSIHSLDYNKYVHLSSVVMEALHVLPQPGTTSDAGSESLLGILDRCRTPQGHRLLAQWLKQPLKDLDAITVRHAAVEALVSSTEARLSLHESLLRRVPDLQALGLRVHKRRAGLKELYRVYEGVLQLPSLISILESLVQNAEASNLNTILTSLQTLSKDMEKYKEMIETTIDIERFQSEREFFIRPSFDEDLQEMMDRKDGVMSKMLEYLGKTARKLGLVVEKSIKLENTPQGFAYRITQKSNSGIDDCYTVLDTVRGGVRFQDDKLAKASEEYLVIQREYEAHQKSIVEEVIGISVGYTPSLNQLSEVLAQLDVLVSFAVAASAAPAPYVRPLMRPMGGGSLVLEQARHPIVELQSGVSYIPNDVYFKDGEVKFYLVTGPNMGGKSTLIRSVGVCVYLAHVGSFVPCSAAHVSIVDQIFTRVGAADSQHRGLSTFMMEMNEAATLLKKCTENSLVIIDELGRGTSTFDGFGMAYAIARELATKRKPFTLFSTHFHEIASLSRVIPTFRNVHVSALEQEHDLILLYQVKPGPCMKSYGVHCAKMAGYPEDLLVRAREMMKEYEFDLDLTPREATGGDVDMQDPRVPEMEYFRLVQDGSEEMFRFLRQCLDLGREKTSLSPEDLRQKFLALSSSLNTQQPYIHALLEKAKLTQ